jgi:hypothetical protein
VVFQPSRIGGDQYKIVCSLFLDASLDSVEDVTLPAPAQAGAGTFEVFRKITVHYLVRGSQAELACDPAAIGTKIKEVYLQEAKIVVDVRQAPIDNDVYKRALVAAVEDVAKKKNVYTQFPCFPLIGRNILDLNPPANSPGIVLKSKGDFITSLEGAFQAGKICTIRVAGFLCGEEVQGQSSMTKGVLLIFVNTQVTADEPIPVLLPPNSAFMNGEVLVGQASNATCRADVVNPGNCWGHTYNEVTSQDNRYASTIDVNIGGVRTVTVAYARTGIMRQVVSVVSDLARNNLRNALQQVGVGFNSAQSLTITLTHKGSQSVRHTDRLRNLKTAIDDLMKADGVFIDRKAYFESLKTSWMILGDETLYRQAFQKTFAATWIIQSVVEQYVKLKHPNDEGVFLLHIPGRNNSRVLPELATKFQDLKVAGAFYGDAFFDAREKAVTYVATLDPSGPLMYPEETKSMESIFAHELGHAVFLPHAPRNNPKAVEPSQYKDGCHVKGDNCLMNYDLDSEHFCGVCMLRLRGWNWKPLPNALGTQEYQISFELDDVDTLFSTGATTAQGQKERLQVLGLMNRPLDHPEAEDCFYFSWNHCKEFWPDLEGASSTFINNFFKEVVADFLVEGGRLPGQGTFAKIRAPGGYSVLYSQNHLEARIPEADQGKPAAKPFETFMLGSSRFAAEESFYKANPALGKIPLKATVRRRPAGSDVAWASCPPASGAKVYFELIPVDDIATATDGPKCFIAPDGSKWALVAGGGTQYTSVKPPDLAGTPKGYLDGKLNGYKPAGPNDPDGKNVHKDLGGKRGGTVFCKPRSQGFAEIPFDTKFKFASVVEADDQGVAKIVFTPSRIGGDAYRLRVFVGPNTQDITATDLDNDREDKAETGTMVRWRTVRVCHDIVMPPAQDASECPAESCKKADGNLMPNVDKYLGDLPEVDLFGSLTQELAKAYCELVVEPAALDRISISEYGDDIKATAKELARMYPKYNSTQFAKVSIHREPLTVVANTNDTQFRTTLLTAPVKTTITVRPKDGDPDTALITDKEGITEVTSKGADLLKSGGINYGTREVVLTFDAAQTGKAYEICYHPEKYIDIESLLDFPDTSPFLFNLALPRIYNGLIQPGTKPADVMPDETTKPAVIHAFIDSQTLGLVKGLLMDAAVRGVHKNGGFYPGLLFFHAHRADNYTAIWETGTQEGKGVGNGIFLFDVSDPTRFNGLTLHEMSHGLFLTHAGSAPGAKAAHHDAGDTCVMTYDANDGDHCGQCVAVLRGVNTRIAPFP